MSAPQYGLSWWKTKPIPSKKSSRSKTSTTFSKVVQVLGAVLSARLWLAWYKTFVILSSRYSFFHRTHEDAVLSSSGIWYTELDADIELLSRQPRAATCTSGLFAHRLKN